MKLLTKDLLLTIFVKLGLLFLLWYVCVKGMHPVLESSQEWMFGSKQSVPKSFNK